MANDETAWIHFDENLLTPFVGQEGHCAGMHVGTKTVYTETDVRLMALRGFEAGRSNQQQLRSALQAFVSLFPDRPADDVTGGVGWNPEVTRVYDNAVKLLGRGVDARLLGEKS